MYNSWYLFIITALSVVSIIISYPTQREKKFSLASCFISLVKNKSEVYFNRKIYF